jgi:NADH dehydrogenase [ubiquinone] 1 alpha subcomplex assembly factor 3
MRSSQLLRDSYGQKMLHGIRKAVRKFVPDPRENPMNERPTGYEDFKAFPNGMGAQGYTGSDQQIGGPTLETYMRERNDRFAKDSLPSPEHAAELKRQGVKLNPDGSVFRAPLGGREGYNDLPTTSDFEDVKSDAVQVNEEKVRLRRQLQLESEAQYRKFVAETKRQEMQEEQSTKRRMPHPADPKYDPFKNTPGYRPQDSAKLANWLKTQRESGLTISGEPMNNKAGQERWYNEEKMATQFHANPFSTRVELPRGNPKMEITAISPDSFFIKDKEIIGSIIATESRVYHWNATTFEDVNARTLALLLHLYPVPDILFIGTGRNQYHVDEELRIAFMKRGTVVHCLSTRDASANFGIQLNHKRRVACALLACVPTNGYNKECFGDFIENDAYCLSDTTLGIRVPRQFNPHMYKTNKAAEKFRSVQGTGYGPKYMELPDGRLVRPGTSGTKLRPMLEPGEDVEWEKLPSYHHWYPKETLEDYIENTTFREAYGNGSNRDSSDGRMDNLVTTGQEVNKNDEQPVADLKPWDSDTIPIPTWQYEKTENGDIHVSDPKTGRQIGMKRGAFEKWKKMMQDRKEGKEPTEEVEYDQESIVADQTGRQQDLSKMKYLPLNDGRYLPRRKVSTGRGNNTPYQK